VQKATSYLIWGTQGGTTDGWQGVAYGSGRFNTLWRYADVYHSVLEDINMRVEQALAKGRDQIVSHSVNR
jgi:hypothetical protein